MIGKKKYFHMFLTVFPLFYVCQKCESLLSIIILWFYLKIEGITSLLSIFEKDWLNLFQDVINLSITKNNWFDWKTDDRIPNPALYNDLDWESDLKSRAASSNFDDNNVCKFRQVWQTRNSIQMFTVFIKNFNLQNHQLFFQNITKLVKIYFPVTIIYWQKLYP